MFRTEAFADQAAAEGLARHGRVTIEEVLDKSIAADLHRCLSGNRRWETALNSPEGPVAVSFQAWQEQSSQQRALEFERLRRQARKGFAYLYYRREIHADTGSQSAVLNQFGASLFSQFPSLMEQLTGEPFASFDAHATLYRPGCFLRQHDDTYAGRNRRYAYVLGLSRHWQPDWGGCLHFIDNEKNQVTGLVPAFNTLTVFKVPREHYVSQVSDFALEKRLAVTGWFFGE